MSHWIRVTIKVLITVGLLGFLIYQMDLRVLANILLSADPFFICLGVLIQVVSLAFSSIRWQVILRDFNIHTRFLKLTELNLIGYFFNLFLPSGIGGDFFRAYYLGKREHRGMSTTLTTTVLERSAGLCALLVIGTFFSIFQDISVEGVRLIYVFLVVITLYLLGNVILFHTWIHQKISLLLRRKHLQHIEDKMELVYQGLNRLRHNKVTILKTLVVSLIIQLLAVIIVWVAAHALHIEAPFGVFLVFVPIINLSIMVPVTINGIGLRESLFYLLFSRIGFPVEMAVGLSLMTLFLYCVTAFPGLFVYSLYKKNENLGAPSELSLLAGDDQEELEE
ncbi:MAG: lysylphosphatidylglycerol synthase transmembrane domain-containing protein [Acidobacteriota bacterium]|nr:lysylphosphatidylglycerol synthase transmembrane domain-containing protein [Acidobacteriota bacterium]